MKTSPEEDKASRGEWTAPGTQLPEDAAGNIIIAIHDEYLSQEEYEDRIANLSLGWN